MKKLVDPFKRGLFLRKKLVKDGKVLCVDFAGTLQEKDIHKDLIKDVDVGRYTYRCKINIKDFDPEIRAAKGLPLFDFSDHKAIFDTINADTNFDIPLWFLRKAGDKLENITLYDLPLIYQVMGCNFHDGTKTGGCIQCFVDDKSNVPNQKRGVWLTPYSVVHTFMSAKKSHGTRVLRISGGEPTLVLDHILYVCEEWGRRLPYPVLLQFDTNLSTGRLIEHFEEEKIFPKNILQKIATYNPGVLVSIKGATDQNLQENIQSRMTIDEQIDALKMFVEARIDIYPCMYNPDADHLREYMERMESIFENFLLKTRVFMTKIYSPTMERIANMAEKKGIDSEQLLGLYVADWTANYYRSCEILNEMLMERYGLAYKSYERPGIKIILRK
ncbi:MAG: radical SAM protein [bacterium]|nr:radical SAM protein [bacterium]